MLISKKYQSPNFSDRRGNKPICTVIHYTATNNLSGTCKWLCRPEAKASAHFVIGREGRTYQLVDLEKSAWHAGQSEAVIDGKHYKWLNAHSIGIELINLGPVVREGKKIYIQRGRELILQKNMTPMSVEKHEDQFWQSYTLEQYRAINDILMHIFDKGYHEASVNLFGHSDISPGRKIDPGPAFDWSILRENKTQGSGW